jgi:long-chain fatty acid transport protein
MVIDVQPTFAYKISDKISVGLGVSYVWGKMTIDQVKLLPNPVFAVPALNGLAPYLNGDQTRVIVENNLEGDGSTFGFNGGLLFNITDKFSIGLSGRYMLDLKLKGTMAQTIAGMNEPEILATLNAIPAANLGLTEAEKQQLLAMYLPGNTSVEDDVEAELPLPMTIGGGLAFKVTPKLTLTADVSYTDWKSWDDIVVTVEGTEETVTMREDWSNTIEMGAGAEFLATKKLAVRAGYYTADTPVPDETMNPTILDPNRRHVITGGLGLNLGNWEFNLAGEYVLFGDKTVDEYGFDDRGIAENYAGLYQFKATVITFEAVFHIN